MTSPNILLRQYHKFLKSKGKGSVTDTSNLSPIGASAPIGSDTMPLRLSKGDKSYIVKIH